MENMSIMSGAIAFGIIPKLILWVMEVYALFLGIKALKIYIDKNS
ncbi:MULTISPECIES: hypothetical protein [Clostridium]|uniref:Uncharacterized protein n=2 Tax=Clostridium TaxID=1485 RepID=B2TKQ5_CLOBB|nr:MULTISPECIES: hypothetical protein [Clostridium]ACD21829.1 hypothetical protein CLL_A0657 [Clostridium botulinum B str. Eklund 17B (NRP)]AIY79721.1 putative membrane protein [Clostridium botulinum 202F]MDR5587576.1 hypothetical protein [Clostridium sp. 5N-1]CDH89581.1 hypothetical protein CB17B0591 [Clostridium botulinum B str. Eklund 17B (NRP)]